MIEMHNIKKAYDSHIVFDEVSLSIQDGDRVAIIGRSGSGKSTLLNIIGLLDKPTSGKYLLDGKENISIHSSSARKILRDKIGYLFQNYALLENETVETNMKLAMRYGKYRNKKESISEALSLVGLQQTEKRMIHTLSGGEQQRVALARLLLKPCDLILADEPTGNLDEDNTEIILDLLMNLTRKGKTVVMVTHDHSHLHHFNKVINLDEFVPDGNRV